MAAAMKDLILRRARLADGSVIDLAVQNGRIAALGTLPGAMAAENTVDLAGGVYLSAGWIDSHVHCYPASPIYHDEPDRVGIDGGVTTVVDAGSTGADQVGDFHCLTRTARTQVLALLNIARTGIVTQNELADMAQIDGAAVKQAIGDYPGFIIGLKARMSSSVVGENGLRPLIRAKQIQHENGDVPLMVHIGNDPPDLDGIADLLTAGDIITHCYNGKPNRILTLEGALRGAVRKALDRGVRLDVGHGSASFSFAVARQAIALGILPHTISSDIYCRNRLDGPVHSLAAVMSKFLALGMTLPQVIDCVTVNAAQSLKLTGRGRLAVGETADLTLFALNDTPQIYADADGAAMNAPQQLVPLAAVVAGALYPTQEGNAYHVF